MYIHDVMITSQEFALGQVLSGHSGSVTCLAAMHLPPKLTSVKEEDAPSIVTLIASGSSDSSLIVWERKNLESKECYVEGLVTVSVFMCHFPQAVLKCSKSYRLVEGLCLGWSCSVSRNSPVSPFLPVAVMMVGSTSLLERKARYSRQQFILSKCSWLFENTLTNIERIRLTRIAILFYFFQFVRVMSLSGHEDWVRDLHCIQEGIHIC